VRKNLRTPDGPLSDTPEAPIPVIKNLKAIPSLPRDELLSRLKQKLSELREKENPAPGQKKPRKSRPRKSVPSSDPTDGPAAPVTPTQVKAVSAAVPAKAAKKTPSKDRPNTASFPAQTGAATPRAQTGAATPRAQTAAATPKLKRELHDDAACDFQFGEFVVDRKPKSLVDLANKPGSKKRRIQAELSKLQSQKEHLEAMRPSERKEEQKKLAFERAMQKASGSKLKTDPQRLKKTLKESEKKKTASKQQWDNRKKEQEKHKKQRVEKKDGRKGMGRKAKGRQ